MTYLKSLASVLSFALLSAPAWAADAPSTVVELFTSQGCSSCPPANAFVGGLSEDSDKLVLSYGVTYWDYLGWKDTFGDQRFTQRQNAYGQAFGIGNIYTPQIVLNGSAHSPRYQVSDIDTMPLDPVGDLDIGVKDGKLYVEGATELSVLVTFTPGWQTVDVAKGENRGRSLRLANVVTNIQGIDPNSALDITPQDGKAYAVLNHHLESKKILNAAVFTP